MAAFGLCRDDIDQDAIEVWPENWLPFEVFSRMSTQWRIGHSGPTGLDYVALRQVMDVVGVDDDERLRVFDSVLIMEDSALDEMHKSKR